MDIKYDLLNELAEKVYQSEKLVPEQMYQGAYYSFKTNSPPSFSSEEEKALITAANKIDYHFEDCFFYAQNEIEFNLANIPADENVLRYLKYLQGKLQHLLEMLEAYFDFEAYRTEEERIMRNMWFGTGRPEFREFQKYLAEKANESAKEGYKLTEEEHEKYSSLKANVEVVKYDALGYLLKSYVSNIRKCRYLKEFVQANLTPEKPLIFKVDLDKNTHRLLLMYKTGVFEALYDKYHNHLGAVKFSRLISSMIGLEPDKHEGFRPSVTGLIKEMNNKKAVNIIQTETATIQVNSFLSELGIEL